MGKGKAGRHHLDGGFEGDMAALRFGFIQAWASWQRWWIERRCGWPRSGGLSEARREMTLGDGPCQAERSLGLGPTPERKGLQKWLSNLLRFLDSKIKDSNTIKWNLNWGQTRINLNNFFEVFSNLNLLKISLNIQIQTKALNERLLNWFRKRFQNEIWIFLKNKIDLGLRNKNMHAMKCNLTKYSKIFLSLFRWNALTWQVLIFFFWKSGCYSISCGAHAH
jgi:hypothetical protein